MKREYSDGVDNDTIYFTGVEVEKTPAYGMPTLFVVGVQPVEEIKGILQVYNIQHIFFGANHSFNPGKWDNHEAWENMIFTFLKEDYMCSLDIPVWELEDFHDFGYCEYDNFIPQIRVPIPYTKLWNYNTMVKIDDVDFKATNPGVWCHSLHDLMDRNKFTDWSKYTSDQKIQLTTFSNDSKINE